MATMSSTRRTDRREAFVLDRRDGPWVTVRRVKVGGALDWFTWHLTRRGARRAADLYVRTGRVKGIRP
ncbi:MAG: hypothetical protein QOJ29_3675 [Thermoleophilaceae bacterium]|jgi:hypothetical protein|nr:hypothetical protein [Thermoleophilaceae bacterium]